MKYYLRIPIMLFMAWLTPCQGQDMPEGRVKSAYVLNFAKFAEWPDGTVWAGNKIMLCALGNDVLGGELANLDGRRAGARELQVVEKSGADSGWDGCHLVFIGESERRRAGAIVKALEGTPVLTISDIEDFTGLGGCIGLRVRKDKVVFEVNLVAARKAGLHFPAQLLNLAAGVLGR